MLLMVHIYFLLQLPGREDINCDHISEVVVHLTVDSIGPRTVIRQEGSVTSLSSPLIPHSIYTVLVAYRNSRGYLSPSDLLIINRTLEASKSADTCILYGPIFTTRCSIYRHIYLPTTARYASTLEATQV